jgi:hypothetical protein
LCFFSGFRFLCPSFFSRRFVFSSSFSFLSPQINYSPFICIFLDPIFTFFPLSLSSLASSLNFFCVFLCSFVKSSFIYVLSPFLSFNLLLLSIMFFFCSQLSLFVSTILSLFILNASFMFTFIHISLSNYSSTPLSIFSLVPPITVNITLFFLPFFSLCSIFSPIIFILFIQSASSACHFSSLPLISPLILSLAPPSPLPLPLISFLVLCSPLLSL